jgi:hypothetical protein
MQDLKNVGAEDMQSWRRRIEIPGSGGLKYPEAED